MDHNCPTANTGPAGSFNYQAELDLHDVATAATRVFQAWAMGRIVDPAAIEHMAHAAQRKARILRAVKANRQTGGGAMR